MICNYMIKLQKSKEVNWERGRTIFLDVIGYSVKGRILDWLITIRGMDFSKTDIVNCSSVNKKNGFKVAEWLIKERYIIPSRKLKKAQLYKLNTKDDVVKALINLDNKIINKRF